MRYAAVLLIALCVFINLSAESERPKTIEIGITHWLTEEVDFKEVLALAKKEKKYVLAAFCNNEHRQWKRMKKRVFNNEILYQVSREAVLYNIDIKRPKGKALAEKHRILSSFAMKIFDSSGKLLDTNYFTNNYFVAAKKLVNWFFTVRDGRGPAPRKKTISIGGVNWYTEQNPPEHIMALATRQNKPILLFYNDYWESQSRMFIKNVFDRETFQASAGNVLLLNVDQSRAMAWDYVQRFKLKWPPTIVMISAQGKEVERIQGGLHRYNTDTFANWFADALAGDNRSSLEQRVKNEPENRVAIMKLIRKMNGNFDPAVISMLRRVIQLNPDIYDPLTHEAHERLVTELHSCLDTMKGVEKKKFVKAFQQDFMTAYYNYYPDMFKYSLAGKLVKYNFVLTWLAASDNPAEGAGYFDDFCKAVEGDIDPSNIISYIRTYNHGIELLLKLNRTADAEKWLDKVLAYIKEHETGLTKDDSKLLNYKIIHYVLHLPFIKHYAGKGDIEKAETYAQSTLKAMNQIKATRKMVPSIKERMARNYGVFSGWFLAKTDSQLAEEQKVEKRLRLLCSKAVILSKLGDDQDAVGILRELTDHPPQTGQGDDKLEQVDIINLISNHMMEASVVNDWTFELAKKGVALKPSFKSHAFLAMAYMERDNIAQAISHLEAALEFSSEEWQRSILKSKIEIWKMF